MKEKVPYIKNKWLHKQHGRWYVTLSDGKRLQYARYLIWKNFNLFPKYPLCVHHIDGDKLNDNLTNLQVVSTRNHRRIHNIGNEYGKYPKSETHKKRIGKANESYPIEYLIFVYLQNESISKRNFAKFLGYKSTGFLSNQKRFNGNWTNFKKACYDFKLKHPYKVMLGGINE